jgi:DNA-binding GntR family transcriptional regulator
MTSLAVPLSRGRYLGSAVVGVLRRLILFRQPFPGIHLVDDELANQLGVTRAPLRKALHELHEGLVVAGPARGIYIQGRGYVVEEVAIHRLIWRM